MRGKRAKYLRKLAGEVLLAKGVSLGEDHRVYNQAMNCPRWEEYKGPDGLPMIDPDTGDPMMIIKKGPGTLTHANRHRVLYKQLKNSWKRTNHG